MAEYEGNIVHNEAYRVKKLMQQIRAGEEKLHALQSRYEALDEKYINETTELKERIKRYIAAEIKPVKGRMKGFKPKPRKVVNA